MEVELLTKSEVAQLRRDLTNATTATNEAWWNQCKLMHRVYYSGYGEEVKAIYELWGHQSWHDYVENELGIHVGTANSMLSVAQFFLVTMQGAFKEKEHLLSRQRMRALASHRDKVTKESLNYWVTQARNMTVCALEHKLDGRKVRRKSFSLQMSENEYNLLKQAIDDLMSTGEYESRTEALLSIVRPSKRSAA